MNLLEYFDTEGLTADSTTPYDVTNDFLTSNMNFSESATNDISRLLGESRLVSGEYEGYTDYTGGYDGYQPMPSPPLSTMSTGSSTVFTFPTPAPTPEAALPLVDCLAETPNIDMISLFSTDTVLQCHSSELTQGVVVGKPGDVKEELAFKIRQRRRASGLGEVEKDDETKPDLNVLTKTDVIRRERRKASNRRAATKCRQKKKIAEETLQDAMRHLREENERLQQEVLSLTTSKQSLEDRFTTHLATCTHHQR